MDQSELAQTDSATIVSAVNNSVSILNSYIL